MKRHLCILLCASLLVIQLNGYAQQYKPVEVQYKNYPVINNDAKDSSVLNFLKPYTDSVQRLMTEVIGFAIAPLYKKQPEGPLGNFAADAMKYMGEKTFKRKIDIAVINPGGLRSYLPKGEITVKHIYELMPFDNLIVLQAMNGKQLKLFLDHTANKGGWSFSGLTMKIKNRVADSIFINGKLLHPDSTYVVANTDYVANGGDYSDMLKAIPKMSVGYVYRDAIIEYIREFTRKGKAITASIEKRVTNADE